MTPFDVFWACLLGSIAGACITHYLLRKDHDEPAPQQQVALPRIPVEDEKTGRINWYTPEEYEKQAEDIFRQQKAQPLDDIDDFLTSLDGFKRVKK